MEDMPETIDMGGSSMISVEKFPGGRKMVQNLGSFYDPIPLKGTFMYSGAVDKMNNIKDMWMAGDPVQLTVSGFDPRWVIITSFKPIYHNDYQIDYDINLEVIDGPDVDNLLYVDTSSQSTTSTDTTTNTSSDSTSSSTTTDTTTNTSDTAQPQQTYIVQDGDTLWGIANQFYGNGAEYTKIQEANNIDNPRLLQIGTELVIP